MARYEISNEVRPLDRLITGFASSCGYEIQTVFNDLLRFIIHGFSPGAPPISNWKYKRQQNASFMEMTAEWTRIMQRQIGRSGWFDAFGELHMAYCSKPGQQANGQFFTPSHISELMVMCAPGKKRPDRGWESVCLGSSSLEKPQNPTFLSLLEYWEKRFWLTEFSHLGGNVNPTVSNLVIVTENIRNNPFDMNELKPMNKKLKDILP